MCVGAQYCTCVCCVVLYIGTDETEEDRGLIFNTAEAKHVEYCRRYRSAVLLYPEPGPGRIRMYIPVYYG